MPATVPVSVDRIRRQMNPAPFQAGQTTYVDLGQTDYLAEIECELVGTMTCVGTSANQLTSKGPLALIANLALEVNGRTFPLSADAAAFDWLRKVNFPGSRPPMLAGVASSASPGTQNTWRATIRLPVAMCLDRNDLRGVIWTQNKQTQVRLAVTWASEATAIALGAGNTATFSGQLNVATVSISAPPPTPPQGRGQAGGLYVPASWIHSFTRKSVSISTTGDNPIDLDTGNLIYRLFVAVKNNGDYTTDIVSQLRVVLQDLVAPFPYDAVWLREQMGDLYHFPFDSTTGLPYVPGVTGQPELTGLYVIDLYRTYTDRDVLDTRGLTEVQLIVTINQSAALNGCVVDVYQEQLVPLTAPYTQL
jgi:hypothetical protein